MCRKITKTRTVANNGNAMESRDHSKNGASPKSQMSRGNKRILLFFLFLSLSFICYGQKTKKNKDKISYLTTLPYFETNTLKTVYAYKNGYQVGYIKYQEQLSTVKKIKRTTYWDDSKYIQWVDESYVIRKDKEGDPIYGTRRVQKVDGGYSDRDVVLSSQTDTTYIKECGCDKDYTAGEFKVSKLYPNWSTMSEEQIKEWLIKNCNQETVDKLNNDFIDEKINKKFNK